MLTKCSEVSTSVQLVKRCKQFHCANTVNRKVMDVFHIDFLVLTDSDALNKMLCDWFAF